jgi:hypothetical protein
LALFGLGSVACLGLTLAAFEYKNELTRQRVYDHNSCTNGPLSEAGLPPNTIITLDSPLARHEGASVRLSGSQVFVIIAGSETIRGDISPKAPFEMGIEDGKGQLVERLTAVSEGGRIRVRHECFTNPIPNSPSNPNSRWDSNRVEYQIGKGYARRERL